MLIESSVEIDSRTIYYETPLMLAARKGNDRITKLLIENGANINAKDIFGDTALHGAVEGGKFIFVILL